MHNRVIFSYSTEHLASSGKVRFFYALNGRNNLKGLLDRTKTERVGRAVLIVRPNFVIEMRDFLNYWKCKWKELPVMVE